MSQLLSKNPSLMTLVRACSRPFSREFAKVTLSRALARFPAPVRPAVTRLAAGHPWLADLAVSFPGLLAALAAAAPGPARDHARALVTAGAPLRHVARLLAVPMWLRRLPPEAFPGRLPALPLTDAFACRVANSVPEDAARSAEWLAAVSEAWSVAGEPYALWIARHALDRRLAPHSVPRNRRHVPEEIVRPVSGIGLFAWFSVTRAGPAGALIRDPWHPGLGPTDARRLASAWLERIELALATGEEGLADVWLIPGHAAGFDFVPLRTLADVLDEASIMRNCVASYGGSLGEGYCRLWSVRRDGIRIATLEIYRGNNNPVPMISQMKGPENTEVSPEVWRALYAWLASEPAWAVPVEECEQDFISRSAWHRMWLPYWRARGTRPWLPLAPSPRVLWRIQRTL